MSCVLPTLNIFGFLPSIAKNKIPNCPTPIAKPYAQRLAQETLGLGIKNAKGKNAKVNRSAANRNGGNASKESLITTKLVPHTATIPKAKRRWLAGNCELRLAELFTSEQLRGALGNHHGGRCGIARSNCWHR